MKYWLHRITGGDYALPLASELFQKGYLSIGWSDFSDEKCLSVIRSGWDNFNNMFLEAWGNLPRNRANLWRFVNEMKPGDIVVVPFPYEFAICEILDDNVYTNETIDEGLLLDWDGDPVKKDEQYFLHNKDGNLVDLGFYRRVKIVEAHIPRDYANQDLYSRMKIRQTNAEISDLGSSVKESHLRFAEKKPINLRAAVLEDTRETVLDIIRKLYNDEKFEDLVERYLYAIGANRVDKPSKNETPTELGDADRVGYFDRLGLAVMVQAKKHTDQTDSWAVEQIMGYQQNHSFDGVTLMWVISTCDDYSDEAEKLSHESNVRLINGREFVDMILDAGLLAIA